jgi:hypothetical protein
MDDRVASLVAALRVVAGLGPPEPQWQLRCHERSWFSANLAAGRNPVLLAVEPFVGHLKRAGCLLAQDADMHIGHFAGLRRVNKLQCMGSTEGLSARRKADVDGLGGSEAAAKLVSAICPRNPSLPPAVQGLLVGVCCYNIDSIHLDVSVFGVGKFTKDSGPLAIPGQRAFDGDVFLPADAYSSNLIGQLRRFHVHEPSEFSRRKSISVGKNLGQQIIVNTVGKGLFDEVILDFVGVDYAVVGEIGDLGTQHEALSCSWGTGSDDCRVAIAARGRASKIVVYYGLMEHCPTDITGITSVSAFEGFPMQRTPCHRSHAELFSDLGAQAGVAGHCLNAFELALG